MAVHCLRFTISLLIFAFASSNAHGAQSGYRVVVQRWKTKAADSAIKSLTVLSVSPLPAGEFEFEGFDLSPLGDQVKNPAMLKRIAEDYLQLIENDYYEISGGKAFQTTLSKTEPFT